MTDANSQARVYGAALGITALLIVAADTIARIAPDRMPVMGHTRLGEALAAIAVPALFLLFGRLSAGDPASIVGLRPAALVRGLLAVFVFATAARMIDAATYGVDPMLALGASLHWPDGTFAVLPGLALLVLAAPKFSTARPFFVVGLAAGLFLSRVSTGIVLIDAAAANAIFFVVGFSGCRLIDGFIGSVRHERGEVLLCTTVLVVIVLLAAGVGVARAPTMGLILGAAGVAIVTAFAAELARTRLGSGLGWIGANVLVLLIGVELPLALLGRGPAGSTLAVLVGVGFAIAATVALAALSAWSARRGAAHRLYRRAISA